MFFDINRILFSDFRKIGQDCDFFYKAGYDFVNHIVENNFLSLLVCFCTSNAMCGHKFVSQPSFPIDYRACNCGPG